MSDGSQHADELAQLRSGGEQAVAELFGRYRAKLQRMIAFRLDSRIVGKVDEDDILQDAFMETVRRIQDYVDRPSVPFFVWLRQITNQVLIDTHRRYVEARMRDVNREVSLERGGTLARAEATSQLAREALDGIYVQLSPERVRMATNSDGNGDGAELPPAGRGMQVAASREVASVLENLLVFYDRLAEQDPRDRQVVLESALASRRVGDIRQRLGQLAFRTGGSQPGTRRSRA